MSLPIRIQSYTPRYIPYIFGDRLQLIEEPLTALFSYMEKLNMRNKNSIGKEIDNGIMPILHTVFESYNVPFSFISGHTASVKIPYDLYPAISILDQLPELIHIIELTPKSKGEQFEIDDTRDTFIEHLQLLFKYREWILSFIHSLSTKNNNSNNNTITTKGTRKMSEESVFSNSMNNLHYGPLEGGRRTLRRRKLKSRKYRNVMADSKNKKKFNF